MRNILFLFGVFYALSAIGAEQGALTRAAKKSMLTAQTFPATFADLSFVKRLEVLAEGYEPWESEYDDNGRCITNCAYYGITIDEEYADLKQHTQNVVQELQNDGYLTTTTTAPETQQTQYAPTTSGAPSTQQTQYAPTTSGTPSTTGGVIPLRKQGTESAQIPLMEPVRGKPRISSPFGPRIHPISKKRALHKGIDLAVPTGTQIYAPADGTVVNIWYDKTCGNGLKIAHGMGYETVYCHLQSVNVTNGAKVQKNSVVALSGNTGGSTGPHLHYAIKKDGKFINPSDLIGR